MNSFQEERAFFHELNVWCIPKIWICIHFSASGYLIIHSFTMNIIKTITPTMLENKIFQNKCVKLGFQIYF